MNNDKGEQSWKKTSFFPQELHYPEVLFKILSTEVPRLPHFFSDYTEERKEIVAGCENLNALTQFFVC